MEKGVSPLITAILILLISLSLVVLMWFWLPKFTFQIYPEESFNQTFYRSRACLSLEYFYGLFGFATIKNCGATPLSDFKFHLDAYTVIDLGLSKLDPLEIASFYYLPIPAGFHEIYITSNLAETPSILVNVPRYECIGTQPVESESWYVNDNTTCICSYGSNITVEGLFVSGNGNFSILRCLLYFDNTPWVKMRIEDNSTTRIYNSTINSDDFYDPIWLEDNSTNYIEHSELISYVDLKGASNNIFSDSIFYDVRIDSDIHHNLSITNFIGTDYTSRSVYKDSPMTKYIKAEGSNFTLNFTDVSFVYSFNLLIGDNSNTTINNATFGSIEIYSELPHNLFINNWGWCQNSDYFNNYFKAEGSNFTFNGTYIFSWGTNFRLWGASNNTITNSCFSGLSTLQYSTNKLVNITSGGGWYLYGDNVTMNIINSRLMDYDDPNNVPINIEPYVSQELNFSNTTISGRHIYFSGDHNGRGNTTIFGNVTFTKNTHVEHFCSVVTNVTRYFPTIIKDSNSYPFPTMQPARISITNNRNQSDWEGSVSGGSNPRTYYIEDPKIKFNRTNYGPGNFLMNVSQVCENLTNIHLLSNTSLEFTIQRAFNYDGTSFGTSQVGGTPLGLAFDNSNFWIASSNNYVYKYSSAGSYSTNFNSNLAGLRDVASNGTYLWLLDSNTKKVYRHRTSDYGYDNWNFDISIVNEPYAVDFDGEYFWVLNGSSVFRYNTAGSYTGFSFNLDRLETPLSYPDIVSVNGNIWILTKTYSESKGRGVFRYKTNGVYDNWYFDTAPTVNSGHGLAYNGTYFWVLNSTGGVYRYNLTRNCLESMKQCDVFITFLPYTINKNNTRYCLLHDLYVPNRTAIDFSSSIRNSSLDCLGYNIDGNDASNTGVYLKSNSRNNTIKNCVITDFYDGIEIESSNNNLIFNNKIENNTENGVDQYCVVCSVENNTFINNTFINNAFGVYLGVNVHHNIFIGNVANRNGWTGFFAGDGGNYNHTFINNTANNNGNAGFDLEYGNYNNTFINNTANNNKYGFYIEGSYKNILINNNIINNSYGLYLAETYENNITNGSIWNNIGNLDYYLGFSVSSTFFRNTNFTIRKLKFGDTTSWFSYNSEATGNTWLKTNVSSSTNITRKLTRWSQYFIQWNDTSDSNIIARYNITGLAPNEIYYVYNNSVPISGSPFNSGPSGSLSFMIYLPSGQEREIKIKGVCDYYILSSDLPYTIAQNNSLYCAGENLYISGNNATIFNYSIKNSTLDCKGKRIYGNDYTNTFGVFMRINSRNNTIKNCNISDFDVGVRLQNSYNNTISNNKIYSNSNNIHFSYSINNTISNNNLTQSSNENVDLYESDKNTVENNIISESDNNDGVNFGSNSDENIMRNNTVINVLEGFCQHSGTLNKFYNNIVRWTTPISNSMGFRLWSGSSNAILENNIVYDGINHGFYIESDNNILVNNTAYNNDNTGFYLYSSSYNNLTNNNANNNGGGFFLQTGSNNNNLTNNTAINNVQSGFGINDQSNYNNLVNCTALGNNVGVRIEYSSSNNNLINDTAYNNNGYGIYITGGSTTNNIVVNSTAKFSSIGLHIEDGAYNNIAIDNIFEYNSWIGVADCGGYSNKFVNNIVRHNDIGFWCNGCKYDNITNGSIWNSTTYDYHFISTGSSETNNFTNTNFTSVRKIRFNDTMFWFNYNNETTSSIWLKTLVSVEATIRRKITRWSQTRISWNDTSYDSTTTARYNITGLLTSTNYNVYNNSIPIQGSPFNSGPSGSLSFMIYLPVNEEHNITVST